APAALPTAGRACRGSHGLPTINPGEAGPDAAMRLPAVMSRAMAASDLVLALTGASGAPYGVRLLEVLLRAGRAVHLTISPSAVEVMERELDRQVRLDQFDLRDLLGEAAAAAGPGQVHYHHYRNFQAGIASGSFLTGGMVVCPCSMGTVAAIAHGLSQNLIHRAADV